MDTKLLIIILILFSAALFLIGLGAMPLTDPDEVFYAETAKEMLNRGEILTPYIFGKPQFEKPPLYYWLVMLGFKIFGINEFSARAASAIFGILGVIGVYLLGGILINKKAAFFAGIVLATSVKYLVMARACVTDMVLCVFILYAILFFFYKRYILCAVFLGLAVLTKGPIGVFLPFVIIGIYLVLTKSRGGLNLPYFLLGALLFLAVSLPWYLLMYRVHGKEFIDVFFGFHNIIRFLEPEHAWGVPFYYYVPVLAVGFFPWTLFLPLGIWQAFRETDGKLKKTNLFLLAWFLVIFIFFSLSRTKLPTYIFPLYPALALLIGRLWDVFLDKALTKRQEKGINISLYLFILLLIAGLVGLYVAARIKYPTAANMTLIAGAVFVLFMSVFAISLLKRRYATSLVVFTASLIVFAFPVSFFIMPEIGRYESSAEISERLLTFMEPDEALGAETRYRRGVAFYTDREDVLDVHPHHIITEFLKKKERVWCIVKEKNHIQLYDDEEKPYDRPTYVVYRLGKKIIITNKMPRNGEFIKMRTKDDPY